MRPVGKHVWVPIDIEMVEGPPDPHRLIICVQVDQGIAKNGRRTGIARQVLKITILVHQQDPVPVIESKQIVVNVGYLKTIPCGRQR